MSHSDQASAATMMRAGTLSFGGVQRPARTFSPVPHMPHVSIVPQPRSAETEQASAPYCLTPMERAIKRTIDIVGALAFFALFGPMYAMVASVVLLGMGGPVHYWQTRIGRGGSTFRFFKFRSMVHDSDEVLRHYLKHHPAQRVQWETFQKLDNDPRVTRVGRVIRKLSLDELPQFWNVLKGDMSLVGPRPCMVRQRSMYGKHWEHYCHMRPGITGLWQVSGRNRLSFAERAELDGRYASQWSLWLDIKILARTVGVVLTGDGSS